MFRYLIFHAYVSSNFGLFFRSESDFSLHVRPARAVNNPRTKKHRRQRRRRREEKIIKNIFFVFLFHLHTDDGNGRVQSLYESGAVLFRVKPLGVFKRRRRRRQIMIINGEIINSKGTSPRRETMLRAFVCVVVRVTADVLGGDTVMINH